MEELLHSPASMRRLVLTGFMGAGKSTVGPLLARALGWQFLDSDRAIEASHRASVAELFDRFGEAGFRTLEAQAIHEALSRDGLVLALGGGALETPSTRSLLFNSPGNHVVFLETPLDLAFARCEGQNGGATRPVLVDREALAARYTARQQHYRLAHSTLATENRTPDQLTALVLATLSQVL